MDPHHPGLLNEFGLNLALSVEKERRKSENFQQLNFVQLRPLGIFTFPVENSPKSTFLLVSMETGQDDF